MNKRFLIKASHLVGGYFVIIDTKGKYTFPVAGNITSNYMFFKALNELDSENKVLKDKNEELKQLMKELEKQIHLIYMSSMFSTVKSWKGDVSKRYKYSEETDTIYDTANRYGQYNKILDKKEVVMLLNEYETLLKGDN